MTTGDTRAQLGEITASLRALRAENARLEARLEKLEATAAGRSSALLRGADEPFRDARAPAGAQPMELPALTVIKLKPKLTAAPKLMTEVPVVEPPEGIVDELTASSKRPDASDAAADETELAVAQGEFDRAMDLLKTGNPKGAALAMQAFVTQWPRHPRADNALYFAGVGLMSEEEYNGAIASFVRVTQEYPAGDAVVDALLKMAECRMKTKSPQEAKATWERIIRLYPGTPAAQQALAHLASFPAALAATARE